MRALRLAAVRGVLAHVVVAADRLYVDASIRTSRRHPLFAGLVVIARDAHGRIGASTRRFMAAAVQAPGALGADSAAPIRRATADRAAAVRCADERPRRGAAVVYLAGLARSARSAGAAAAIGAARPHSFAAALRHAPVRRAAASVHQYSYRVHQGNAHGSDATAIRRRVNLDACSVAQGAT